VLKLAVPLLAMAAPVLLGVAGVIWLRSRERRLKRRLPFDAEKMLRAGAQVRKRMEDQADGLAARLATLFVLGPLIFSLWAVTRLDPAKVQFGFGEIVLLVVAIGSVVYLTVTMHRHASVRRRLQEALDAEHYVAQELNRLIGEDCHVLHDVPAERFNLDHVVIAPSAVFVVETKSRRKPDGQNGHRVKYDGTRLTFHDRTEDRPIRQAQDYADWLANYLRKALGTSVPVVPVVALPGWYVESNADGARAPVRVMPVGGKSAQFMLQARGVTLEPAVRRLIAQALTLRYPESRASP
jgi:hypothetical protein